MHSNGHADFEDYYFYILAGKTETESMEKAIIKRDVILLFLTFVIWIIRMGIHIMYGSSPMEDTTRPQVPLK